MPFTPWYRTRDEALYEPIVRLSARVQGTGHEADVMVTAVSVYEDTLKKLLAQAPQLSGSIVADAPYSLVAERRLFRRMERNMAWVYGPGFDVFEIMCRVAGDFASAFFMENVDAATTEDDIRFFTLVHLHARALLTAREVAALLRTGYGIGANARWRTLHEVDVVAALIGANDQQLAVRYVDHAAVEAFKDAEHYRDHEPALGVRVGAEDFDALEAARDVVLARHGNGFASQWGWANPLTAPKRATFRDLEELAELDHIRPFYSEASQNLHGGASGTLAVKFDFRGDDRLLTGPTNRWLHSPAHSTAISLLRVTMSLILHGREDDDVGPGALELLAVLDDMTNRVDSTFAAAEDTITHFEAEFMRAQQHGRIHTEILAAQRVLQRHAYLARRAARIVRTANARRRP